MHMIIVTRLNGERFGVNADHLERVEEMPDTVLTLLDGRKYIVQESLDLVIDLVVRYRADILRISYRSTDIRNGDESSLRLVERNKTIIGSGEGER
ncbi:MAG: flagellar protein FlbD [Acidimicrobiales bacterium]|jgi:flagellar protein FlbD